MKLSYLIGAILSCLLISTNLTAQEEVLKRANKAYELGDYRKAINNYKSYLQKSPPKNDIPAKIADAYFNLFDLEQASYWYGQMAKGKMHPDHQLAYAHILKMRGQYAEAKKWYLSYSKYNPNIGNHYANSCDVALLYAAQASIYEVSLDYNNSNTSDFAPAFYRNSLVYASSRGDVGKIVAKNWTGNKYNYLFKAALGSKGEIGRPAYYHGELTDFDKNEGPISFSADGRWVAFCKNKYVNGVRQLSKEPDLDLYIAEVGEDGTWKNAIAFPHNNGAYSTGWPYLSEDGTTLYFASNMPIVGRGGYDIYKSKKMGDTWTSPENLGSKINTAGNEVSPYLIGKELYFSSDWHAGMGGLDVFRCVKENGAWNEIFNLGKGINSAQDDYGWIYDGERNLGYVVSNRTGGKGKEDIYRFNKMGQEVEILVLDALNKTPINNVKIDFSACNGPIEQTDYKGRLSFQALDEYSCTASFSKSGYQSLSRTIKKEGGNQRQKIEVLLTNNQDAYSGTILNAANNKAVNNAIVKLTNQATGKITKTYSNGRGQYSLALETNQRYILKYSKSGYTETSRLLETKNIIPASIFGEYTMIPVGYKEQAPVFASAPSPKPRKKNKPSIQLTKPNKINYGQTEKGFAIQVMSIKASSSKIPNFNKLSKLAEVYVVEIDGLKKFRLGPFDSRAAAAQAGKRAKKMGYKNFVVAEKEGLKKEVLHGLTAKGGEVVEATKLPETIPEEYKIQLGVFKNPDNFDTKSLKPYGSVEKKKRQDGLTVVLLTGLSGERDAKQTLKRVNNIGFAKAFMVKEINGKIERL